MIKQTGLQLALSLGSIFLYTGVISDSSTESGNLLSIISLISLLIQLVKSKKQISLFCSTFTGMSPGVALSEGKFFKTFLALASETHWN